jgi:hypothetical protein
LSLTQARRIRQRGGCVFRALCFASPVSPTGVRLTEMSLSSIEIGSPRRLVSARLVGQQREELANVLLAGDRVGQRGGGLIV